jgi:hypothetical protein
LRKLDSEADGSARVGTSAGLARADKAMARGTRR